MAEQELKSQVFQTLGQWERGGLLYRLKTPEDGGISLYSVPSFSRWILAGDGIKSPVYLAVDDCGQFYLIDKETERKEIESKKIESKEIESKKIESKEIESKKIESKEIESKEIEQEKNKEKEYYRIYRYDPEIERLEPIPCSGSSEVKHPRFKNPKKIVVDRFTLWVFDAGNRDTGARITAFSRENYQIKYILEDFTAPIDISLGEGGCLYVLDKKGEQTFEIHKYDVYGNLCSNKIINGETPDKSCLKDPAGFAAGKENILFFIDKECNGFFKCTDLGEYSGIVGNFSKVFPDINGPGEFNFSSIFIDIHGNIFVIFAVDSETSIHQFDPDGSYIGKIPVPGFAGRIYGITVDRRGRLYACTDKGIARFDVEQRFTKQEGVYYSRTLDSGIQNCQWHRLFLDAKLPPGTLLKVCYNSSDDPKLKEEVEKILKAQTDSIQSKAEKIEDTIKNWTESEKNPKDMLFRGKTGRYLWLKLVLSTFEENSAPAISRMRVYYPRISYLRYLPAIYQEDPVSRDFLERFLSLFESVFYGLETDISEMFKLFDPETVPPKFLAWLASWLNLSMEEGWPEDKKRYFIRRAVQLYKLKGTKAGIEELVRIYTGKKPLILEDSKIGKPMVLSRKEVSGRSQKEAFRLGFNTVLQRTPVRGFRLGDDSILGKTALRDVTQAPDDPFLQTAYRFTVILDMSLEEFNRYEKGLRQVLDEEKPAHTEYTLRTGGGMNAGMGMYVGMNTKLSDYTPITLGDPAQAGSGTAIGYGFVVKAKDKDGRIEKGGRIELYSRLGKDVELI
ncbi:phage tail protein [Methanosarcina sp. Mfa9]|uniref:phage tail protein n=1 Tax=Methanosarcina sp. Mfa9 TaxID=3439063 RepID=UPI003F878235